MTRLVRRALLALFAALAAMLLGAAVAHAATMYTYDNLGRLTQVVYGSGTTLVYTYDAAGNRTAHNVSGLPGISVVSGSPQIASLGTPFAAPLKVKVTDSFGNGASGVTVTFTPPMSGASANCTAPAATDAGGFTQTSCTANGVAGGYAVNATASGIVAPAVFLLINHPGATGTTIALAASANPAFFAASVTLTATVTGNAPTGTVDFRVSGVSIPGCAAQPLASGVATCVTSSLVIGANNVTAIYSGDGQNAPGTSAILALQVVPEIGLPDTGQELCYDNADADAVGASNAASIARDAGTHPRQDCRYGRDPAVAAGALAKIGAGMAGRDYTKVANNGATPSAAAVLGTGPSDWACTKDNVTGLTWELKTADSGELRYMYNTYTWYSTNAATNGGDPGSVGSNTCNSTLPGGQCNTQAYVAAINAAQLCGFSDWRLPTHRELLTLVFLDGFVPTIETNYFPNTLADPFWSSTTYARFPDSAWNVDFLANYLNNAKTNAYRVRLVRGAGF